MASIPTSVRFQKSTEERLKQFLDVTPSFTAKDVIDFAVQNLFTSLDQGAEIRIGKDGLKLVPPTAPIDPVAESQAIISASTKKLNDRSGEKTKATVKSS